MSNGAYARILCSYIPILHLLDTIDHHNPNAITFQPLSIIPVHPHLLLGEPFKCCSNNKNNNNTRTAPSTDFLFILQERRQSSYLQIFQENLFISSINPSIHIRYTSFWPDKQTDRQTVGIHLMPIDFERVSKWLSVLALGFVQSQWYRIDRLLYSIVAVHYRQWDLRKIHTYACTIHIPRKQQIYWNVSAAQWCDSILLHVVTGCSNLQLALSAVCSILFHPPLHSAHSNHSQKPPNSHQEVISSKS